MRKSINIFNKMDRSVDHVVNPFWKHFKKYFPFVSAFFLIIILVFFFTRVFRDKPYFATTVLNNEVSKIADALNKVDYDCSILSIENEKNPVDFLTVKTFVGSEIGSLNVAYPKNWKGPYLLDNPRFEGKLYQIIKTKQGAFVIPGDGVKLPNGQVVNKSFRINYDSDVSKMLDQGGQLNYQGTSLGKKLEFKIGDLGKTEVKKSEIEQINKALEEFNEAMPFACNQTAPFKF